MGATKRTKTRTFGRAVSGWMEQESLSHGTSPHASAYHLWSGHESVADIPNRTALAGPRRADLVRGALAAGHDGTPIGLLPTLQSASGHPLVLRPQREGKRPGRLRSRPALHGRIRLPAQCALPQAFGGRSLLAKLLKIRPRVFASQKPPSGHFVECRFLAFWSPEGAVRPRGQTQGHPDPQRRPLGLPMRIVRYKHTELPALGGATSVQCVLELAATFITCL